jgi:hypothetical protein
LELGIHLVRELELEDTCNTLGRWMAHHLAEVMDEIKNAKTDEDRSASTERATNLILALWKQRRTLPGGGDPLATYRDVLPTLKLLNADASKWSNPGRTQSEKLVIQLFNHVREIVRSTLGDVLPSTRTLRPVARLVLSFLSGPEQKVVTGLDQLLAARQRLGLDQAKDSKRDGATSPPIISEIDAATNTLQELKTHLVRTTTAAKPRVKSLRKKNR